jgi:hypothetical protein
MSATDYLWPARPEYLRRCSVVVPYGEGLVAVVVEIDGNDLLLTGQLGGGGWKAAHAVRIDLRDVTARAHAAMAWTMIRNSDGSVAFSSAIPDIAVMDCGMWLQPRALQMLRVLVRMRSMDESVTVDEAREALGWAERVAGVAP